MSVGGAILTFGIVGALVYKQSLKLETLKEKQQLAVAFVVIVIIGFLISTGRDATADNKFRDQFLLPDNAEIFEMHMPHQGYPPRAIYRIPEPDWENFVAGLNKTPTPYLFRFTADPIRHGQIAQWKDLPPPMFAAGPDAHLYDLTSVYGFTWKYQITNGKIMCIVYLRGSADGARACENLSRNSSRYAFAVGVIDFDRRLVHMQLRDNTGGFRLY